MELNNSPTLSPNISFSLTKAESLLKDCLLKPGDPSTLANHFFMPFTEGKTLFKASLTYSYAFLE